MLFAVIFGFLDSVLIVLRESLEKESNKAVIIKFLVDLALSDSICIVDLEYRVYIFVERTAHYKSECNEYKNGTCCSSRDRLPFDFRIEVVNEENESYSDYIAENEVPCDFYVRKRTETFYASEKLHIGNYEVISIGIELEAFSSAHCEEDNGFDQNGYPARSEYSEEEYNIMRLCDIYNVPFATNIATAEALILALDQGTLDWRDLVNPKSKTTRKSH